MRRGRGRGGRKVGIDQWGEDEAGDKEGECVEHEVLSRGQGAEGLVGLLFCCYCCCRRGGS